MSVTIKNTYVLGSNQDLSNALLNIDINRIGIDITYLEDDGGTLKVSIGSLIESEGSIYAVSGTAETPTGTAQDGSYLFFDASVPGFAWSTTPGTYDPLRGGIYDGSDRRQCRFRLKSATTWDVLLVPESPDALIGGDVQVDGDFNVDGTSTLGGTFTGNLFGWTSNGFSDSNTFIALSNLRDDLAAAGIPENVKAPVFGYVQPSSNNRFYVVYSIRYTASEMDLYWTFYCDSASTFGNLNVLNGQPFTDALTSTATWAVAF